ncbi:isochorismate synthase [Agromyces mangrovi Wang et al. 2018]|uniref:isochorismate synthase n=1 Tax=Agromyces mangrovi TaxID=1858653 RepID=UPI0025741070|nr:isochorismate synthase [Agromyces mangrovi]BDZ65029.1 isochorismate synthase [Agromyces mangrovi]
MTFTGPIATAGAAHPTARTRLHVETRGVVDPGELLPLTDASAPLAWLREGEGIVGIGEALRLEFGGASRFADAADAWRAIADLAEVADAVDVPGSGLVAFASFAFADDSASPSALVVPAIVAGRRGGRAWITRIRPIDGGTGSLPPLPHPTAFGSPWRVKLRDGALPPAEYEAAVADAVRRIQGGEFEKVVLARELRGRMPRGADVRRLVSKLSTDYPDTWTFAVDGLVGASPETLVRVDRGGVSARVLAGTASRGVGADGDHDAELRLATSTKDRDEHAFAVRSAIETLRPHTSRLEASAEPFTVRLPNLWHLATDLDGTLGDGSTSLDLVAAMHPTAAVAGSPTDVATAAIADLEGFDRGRYAGPVGWIGADGDGEWAIALRCAQIGPDGSVRAHAGAGIVRDSDPGEELAESTIKFAAIVDAIG